MERRTLSEPAQTGTLPVAGTGALPVTGSPAAPSEPPAWLEEARSTLTQPGRFLAYEDSDGRVKIVSIAREWTRVGRSLAADVRFDDATVSRRHALIVVNPDGVRVLDDRSLNGVSVNGRRVEWSPLKDGDEISVGRHRLIFIDTATVGAAGDAPETVLAAE